MKFISKNAYVLRVILLLAGIAVSWVAVINSFVNFYNVEGTIFKIKDCLIPNPITTPCFWGALAFLGGTMWAYKLHKNSNIKKEKYFFYFITFCILFAWSNFAIELRGVTPKPGAIIAPCPAAPYGPFLSPCFFGSILFTLTFLLNFYVLKKSSKLK